MPIFDLQTLLQLFAVALAGGIVGLDRTAAGQFMISQPIVAGPLTGWLLGDAAAGMIIGGVLELIWVLDIPVGTFVPADATIGAVSATAIAVLSSRGDTAPLDLIGFCLLLTTTVVPITMLADEFVRKRNSGLADAALAGPFEEPGCTLSRAHLSGLAAFFLKSFVVYLFFIPAGLAAVGLFWHLTEQVHAGMSLFVKALPLLGAAMMLHKLSIAALDRFFIAGFAGVAGLGILLHGRPLVMILLIILGGVAGARFSERRS